MARYVSTVRFTQQGLSAIHDTTKRAAAFKAAAKKLKVKVVENYWCLGPFDGLLIFDAEDEAAATAAMLQLAAHGNVTTRTARLFDSAEMTKILKNVQVE